MIQRPLQFDEYFFNFVKKRENIKIEKKFGKVLELLFKITNIFSQKPSKTLKLKSLSI